MAAGSDRCRRLVRPERCPAKAGHGVRRRLVRCRLLAARFRPATEKRGTAGPDGALQGRWGVLPRPSGKRRTAMAGRIRPAFLGGPKRGGRCRQIWGGHCRLDWGDVCRLLPGGHCRRTSWGIGCGAGAGAAGGGDRAPAVLRAGRAAGTWARDPEGNGVLRGRRLGSGKTTCATETLPGSLAYRISQLGSPIDDSPEPV